MTGRYTLNGINPRYAIQGIKFITEFAMSSIARRPRELGTILQRQRRLLRLTQTDVSDLIGTGQKTISKIENGNPAIRIDTLFSLLAALDLELSIQPRGKGWPIDPEDIF